MHTHTHTHTHTYTQDLLAEKRKKDMPFDSNLPWLALPQPSPLPATDPTVAAAEPVSLPLAYGYWWAWSREIQLFQRSQLSPGACSCQRSNEKEEQRWNKTSTIYEALAISAPTPNHLPKGAGLKEPHFPFLQATQVSREPTQLILNWFLMGGQKADPTEMLHLLHESTAWEPKLTYVLK